MTQAALGFLSVALLSACCMSVFSCALLHIACVSLFLSIILLSVFAAILCSDHLCIINPKHDLSDKDAPGKKKARKSITLEQKMDISRRYDGGGVEGGNRPTPFVGA